MKYMFIAAVLLAATSAHAEGQFPAKKAQCFLQVNGAAKIDGVCDLTSTALPGEKQGGFEVSNGTDGRWFAYVTPNGDGTANATWNGEDGASHAMDDLPMLHKEGACWVNGTTKICAWKLGEKRAATVSTSQTPAHEDDDAIDTVKTDIIDTYNAEGRYAVKSIKLLRLNSWAMSGVVQLSNWHGGLEGCFVKARWNESTKLWNWECH